MNCTKRPPPRCQGSESCSLEHIYGALAEKERAMISVRTKEALARLGDARLGEVRGTGVESSKEGCSRNSRSSCSFHLPSFARGCTSNDSLVAADRPRGLDDRLRNDLWLAVRVGAPVGVEPAGA
jgi:hypothetical protein